MLLQFLTKIESFVRSESGATAIEYGLIAAGIAVAISTVVFAMGDSLVALFNNISTKLDTAAAK